MSHQTKCFYSPLRSLLHPGNSRGLWPSEAPACMHERAPRHRTKGVRAIDARKPQLGMARVLQTPVFSLPGCQQLSVNTLLCVMLSPFAFPWQLLRQQFMIGNLFVAMVSERNPALTFECCTSSCGASPYRKALQTLGQGIAGAFPRAT